ncbi:MAG: hypothetical protein AB8B81_03690 [Halioglobus sp.]
MVNQYIALRHLEPTSHQYFIQALGWMWSIALSLMFLSVFYLGLSWMAPLLLMGVIAFTVAMFRERKKLEMLEARATSGFSSSSRCVWKLDSEA